MTSSRSDPFAQSYREAREKFLAAVDAAGFDAEAYGHPLLGRDGEALALEHVLVGAADSKRLLMISSGCHGVEGYCGSAIQIDLLGNRAFLEAADRAGVSLLLLHALNPHGFSWWRRVTHENVDLNRNFVDFHAALPENPGYDAIAHQLVPGHWPPSADNEAALMRFAAEHGERGFQTAVSAGQYRHPEGLFYGGQNPTWSQTAFRQALRDRARHCERLAWIDLHTGLGPAGVGERIFNGRDDAAAVARARAWWGDRLTSLHDDSSSSARLTGMAWQAVHDECPQAEYTGIALEFGTVPLAQVLRAMRAEQWLENHPETPAELAGPIKRSMRDVFYVDSDDWKAAILAQGREVALQAVAGLATI